MARRYTASAPGSLMLLGEHAVLHGRHAVVCAVDRRMRVTIEPRADKLVRIHSDLAAHETDLDALDPHPRLAFVMEAIRGARPKTGLDLRIVADFPHTIGFGSSAAVTVATLAALRMAHAMPPDRNDLFAAARDTIRAVQGRGSGADAAASLFGGVIGYRSEPLEIEQVRATHPLTAVYSGVKTATPEAIAMVEEGRRGQPELYDAIFDAMDCAATLAVDAVQRGDWIELGELLNVGQGLMEAIGVGTPALSEIVHALRRAEDILGAKISGSGLGDCAVGLGHAALQLPYETFPLAIDTEGLVCEES